MRGTEVTEAQMQSAREFASARRCGSFEGVIVDDITKVSLSFGDMCRLMAWYGAIRYTAGKTGVGGTFEEPGPIGSKP